MSGSESPKVSSSELTNGLVERIAEKRSVPGVLSFTDSMDLLYMNAEAEELGQHLIKARHGNGAIGLVPSEITDLCQDLQKEMKVHPDPKEQEHIQLRKVINDVKFPILLRGFLIPSPSGEHAIRFLILMEKIGRRSQVVSHEARKRFHLTDREHEIVMHVADGRTNKEIAGILDISEHTVKEHIKHILRKTHTTTRTGILAQIFRYS